MEAVIAELLPPGARRAAGAQAAALAVDGAIVRAQMEDAKTALEGLALLLGLLENP